MNCQRIDELLPWYLNSTLEAEEARRVERHLAECTDCTEGLADVRFTAAAVSAHLPTEMLVARGFGEALPAGWDAAVVEAHLGHCERCAEELELVRASRAELEAGEGEGEGRDRGSDAAVVDFPSPPPPRPGRWSHAAWRGLAAAAVVVAAISAGGWWSAEREAERLADAPAGVAAERLADLERELAEARVPRVNQVVADLLPAEAVQRGGAAPGAAQRVELPPGAEAVTLLLAPPDRAELAAWDDFRLVVAAPGGAARFEREGIEPQPGTGDFTLYLPLDWLPGDRVDLELHGRRDGTEELVATWSAELVRAGG